MEISTAVIRFELKKKSVSFNVYGTGKNRKEIFNIMSVYS